MKIVVLFAALLLFTAACTVIADPSDAEETALGTGEQGGSMTDDTSTAGFSIDEYDYATPTPTPTTTPSSTPSGTPGGSNQCIDPFTCAKSESDCKNGIVSSPGGICMHTSHPHEKCDSAPYTDDHQWASCYDAPSIFGGIMSTSQMQSKMNECCGSKKICGDMIVQTPNDAGQNEECDTDATPCKAQGGKGWACFECKCKQYPYCGDKIVQQDLGEECDPPGSLCEPPTEETEPQEQTLVETIPGGSQGTPTGQPGPGYVGDQSTGSAGGTGSAGTGPTSDVVAEFTINAILDVTGAQVAGGPLPIPPSLQGAGGMGQAGQQQAPPGICNDECKCEEENCGCPKVCPVIDPLDPIPCPKPKEEEGGERVECGNGKPTAPEEIARLTYQTKNEMAKEAAQKKIDDAVKAARAAMGLPGDTAADVDYKFQEFTLTEALRLEQEEERKQQARQEALAGAAVRALFTPSRAATKAVTGAAVSSFEQAQCPANTYKSNLPGLYCSPSNVNGIYCCGTSSSNFAEAACPAGEYKSNQPGLYCSQSSVLGVYCCGSPSSALQNAECPSGLYKSNLPGLYCSPANMAGVYCCGTSTTAMLGAHCPTGAYASTTQNSGCTPSDVSGVFCCSATLTPENCPKDTGVYYLSVQSGSCPGGIPYPNPQYMGWQCCPGPASLQEQLKAKQTEQAMQKPGKPTAGTPSVQATNCHDRVQNAPLPGENKYFDAACASADNVLNTYASLGVPDDYLAAFAQVNQQESKPQQAGNAITGSVIEYQYYEGGQYVSSPTPKAYNTVEASATTKPPGYQSTTTEYVKTGTEQTTSAQVAYDEKAQALTQSGYTQEQIQEALGVAPASTALSRAPTISPTSMTKTSTTTKPSVPPLSIATEEATKIKETVLGVEAALDKIAKENPELAKRVAAKVEECDAGHKGGAEVSVPGGMPDISTTEGRAKANQMCVEKYGPPTLCDYRRCKCLPPCPSETDTCQPNDPSCCDPADPNCMFEEPHVLITEIGYNFFEIFNPTDEDVDLGDGWGFEAEFESTAIPEEPGKTFEEFMQIIDTWPKPGDQYVPPTTQVLLAYSDDVSAASVSTVTVEIKGPEGVVNGDYVVADNFITFTPETSLSANTLYEVHAQNVLGEDGKKSVPGQFVFMTGDDLGITGTPPYPLAGQLPSEMPLPQVCSMTFQTETGEQTMHAFMSTELSANIAALGMSSTYTFGDEPGEIPTPVAWTEGTTRFAIRSSSEAQTALTQSTEPCTDAALFNTLTDEQAPPAAREAAMNTLADRGTLDPEDLQTIAELAPELHDTAEGLLQNTSPALAKIPYGTMSTESLVRLEDFNVRAGLLGITTWAITSLFSAQQTTLADVLSPKYTSKPITATSISPVFSKGTIGTAADIVTAPEPATFEEALSEIATAITTTLSDPETPVQDIPPNLESALAPQPLGTLTFMFPKVAPEPKLPLTDEQKAEVLPYLNPEQRDARIQDVLRGSTTELRPTEQACKDNAVQTATTQANVQAEEDKVRARLAFVDYMPLRRTVAQELYADCIDEAYTDTMKQYEAEARGEQVMDIAASVIPSGGIKVVMVSDEFIEEFGVAPDFRISASKYVEEALQMISGFAAGANIDANHLRIAQSGHALLFTTGEPEPPLSSQLLALSEDEAGETTETTTEPTPEETTAPTPETTPETTPEETAVPPEAPSLQQPSEEPMRLQTEMPPAEEAIPPPEGIAEEQPRASEELLAEALAAEQLSQELPATTIARISEQENKILYSAGLPLGVLTLDEQPETGIWGITTLAFADVTGNEVAATDIEGIAAGTRTIQDQYLDMHVTTEELATDLSVQLEQEGISTDAPVPGETTESTGLPGAPKGPGVVDYVAHYNLDPRPLNTLKLVISHFSYDKNSATVTIKNVGSGQYVFTNEILRIKAGGNFWLDQIPYGYWLGGGEEGTFMFTAAIPVSQPPIMPTRTITPPPAFEQPPFEEQQAPEIPAEEIAPEPPEEAPAEELPAEERTPVPTITPTTTPEHVPQLLYYTGVPLGIAKFNGGAKTGIWGVSTLAVADLALGDEETVVAAQVTEEDTQPVAPEQSARTPLAERPEVFTFQNAISIRYGDLVLLTEVLLLGPGTGLPEVPGQETSEEFDREVLDYILLPAEQAEYDLVMLGGGVQYDSKGGVLTTDGEPQVSTLDERDQDFTRTLVENAETLASPLIDAAIAQVGSGATADEIQRIVSTKFLAPFASQEQSSPTLVAPTAAAITGFAIADASTPVQATEEYIRKTLSAERAQSPARETAARALEQYATFANANAINLTLTAENNSQRTAMNPAEPDGTDVAVLYTLMPELLVGSDLVRTEFLHNGNVLLLTADGSAHGTTAAGLKAIINDLTNHLLNNIILDPATGQQTVNVDHAQNLLGNASALLAYFNVHTRKRYTPDARADISIVVYSPVTGIMQYAGGGLFIYVIHAGGRYDEIALNGTLGTGTTNFSINRTVLTRGMTLLLPSYGLREQQNMTRIIFRNSEEFNETLAYIAFAPAQQAPALLQHALNAHRGKDTPKAVAQEDEYSAIILKLTAQPAQSPFAPEALPPEMLPALPPEALPAEMLPAPLPETQPTEAIPGVEPLPGIPGVEPIGLPEETITLTQPPPPSETIPTETGGLPVSFQPPPTEIFGRTWNRIDYEETSENKGQGTPAQATTAPAEFQRDAMQDQRFAAASFAAQSTTETTPSTSLTGAAIIDTGTTTEQPSTITDTVQQLLETFAPAGTSDTTKALSVYDVLAATGTTADLKSFYSSELVTSAKEELIAELEAPIEGALTRSQFLNTPTKQARTFATTFGNKLVNMLTAAPAGANTRKLASDAYNKALDARLDTVRSSLSRSHSRQSATGHDEYSENPGIAGKLREGTPGGLPPKEEHLQSSLPEQPPAAETTLQETGMPSAEDIQALRDRYAAAGYTQDQQDAAVKAALLQASTPSTVGEITATATSTLPSVTVGSSVVSRGSTVSGAPVLSTTQTVPPTKEEIATMVKRMAAAGYTEEQQQQAVQFLQNMHEPDTGYTVTGSTDTPSQLNAEQRQQMIERMTTAGYSKEAQEQALVLLDRGMTEEFFDKATDLDVESMPEYEDFVGDKELANDFKKKQPKQEFTEVQQALRSLFVLERDQALLDEFDTTELEAQFAKLDPAIQKSILEKMKGLELTEDGMPACMKSEITWTAEELGAIQQLDFPTELITRHPKKGEQPQTPPDPATEAYGQMQQYMNQVVDPATGQTLMDAITAAQGSSYALNELLTKLKAAGSPLGNIDTALLNQFGNMLQDALNGYNGAMMLLGTMVQADAGSVLAQRSLALMSQKDHITDTLGADVYKQMEGQLQIAREYDMLKQAEKAAKDAFLKGDMTADQMNEIIDKRKLVEGKIKEKYGSVKNALNGLPKQIDWDKLGQQAQGAIDDLAGAIEKNENAPATDNQAAKDAMNKAKNSLQNAKKYSKNAKTGNKGAIMAALAEAADGLQQKAIADLLKQCDEYNKKVKEFNDLIAQWTHDWVVTCNYLNCPEGQGAADGGGGAGGGAGPIVFTVLPFLDNIVSPITGMLANSITGAAEAETSGITTSLDQDPAAQPGGSSAPPAGQAGGQAGAGCPAGGCAVPGPAGGQPGPQPPPGGGFQQNIDNCQSVPDGVECTPKAFGSSTEDKMKVCKPDCKTDCGDPEVEIFKKSATLPGAVVLATVPGCWVYDDPPCLAPPEFFEDNDIDKLKEMLEKLQQQFEDQIAKAKAAAAMQQQGMGALGQTKDGEQQSYTDTTGATAYTSQGDFVQPPSAPGKVPTQKDIDAQKKRIQDRIDAATRGENIIKAALQSGGTAAGTAIKKAQEALEDLKKQLEAAGQEGDAAAKETLAEIEQLKQDLADARKEMMLAAQNIQDLYLYRLGITHDAQGNYVDSQGRIVEIHDTNNDGTPDTVVWSSMNVPAAPGPWQPPAPEPGETQAEYNARAAQSLAAYQQSVSAWQDQFAALQIQNPTAFQTLTPYFQDALGAVTRAITQNLVILDQTQKAAMNTISLNQIQTIRQEFQQAAAPDGNYDIAFIGYDQTGKALVEVTKLDADSKTIGKVVINSLQEALTPEGKAYTFDELVLDMDTSLFSAEEMYKLTNNIGIGGYQFQVDADGNLVRDARGNLVMNDVRFDAQGAPYVLPQNALDARAQAAILTQMFVDGEIDESHYRNNLDLIGDIFRQGMTAEQVKKLEEARLAPGQIAETLAAFSGDELVYEARRVIDALTGASYQRIDVTDLDSAAMAVRTSMEYSTIASDFEDILAQNGLSDAYAAMTPEQRAQFLGLDLRMNAEQRLERQKQLLQQGLEPFEITALQDLYNKMQRLESKLTVDVYDQAMLEMNDVLLDELKLRAQTEMLTPQETAVLAQDFYMRLQEALIAEQFELGFTGSNDAILNVVHDFKEELYTYSPDVVAAISFDDVAWAAGERANVVAFEEAYATVKSADRISELEQDLQSQSIKAYDALQRLRDNPDLRQELMDEFMTEGSELYLGPAAYFELQSFLAKEAAIIEGEKPITGDPDEVHQLVETAAHYAGRADREQQLEDLAAQRNRLRAEFDLLLKNPPEQKTEGTYADYLLQLKELEDQIKILDSQAQYVRFGNVVYNLPLDELLNGEELKGALGTYDTLIQRRNELVSALSGATDPNTYKYIQEQIANIDDQIQDVTMHVRLNVPEEVSTYLNDVMAAQAHDRGTLGVQRGVVATVLEEVSSWNRKVEQYTVATQSMVVEDIARMADEYQLAATRAAAGDLDAAVVKDKLGYQLNTLVNQMATIVGDLAKLSVERNNLLSQGRDVSEIDARIEQLRTISANFGRVIDQLQGAGVGTATGRVKSLLKIADVQSQMTPEMVDLNRLSREIAIRQAQGLDADELQSEYNYKASQNQEMADQLQVIKESADYYMDSLKKEVELVRQNIAALKGDEMRIEGEVGGIERLGRYIAGEVHPPAHQAEIASLEADLAALYAQQDTFRQFSMANFEDPTTISQTVTERRNRLFGIYSFQKDYELIQTYNAVDQREGFRILVEHNYGGDVNLAKGDAATFRGQAQDALREFVTARALELQFNNPSLTEGDAFAIASNEALTLVTQQEAGAHAKVEFLKKNGITENNALKGLYTGGTSYMDEDLRPQRYRAGEQLMYQIGTDAFDMMRPVLIDEQYPSWHYRAGQTVDMSDSVRSQLDDAWGSLGQQNVRYLSHERYFIDQDQTKQMNDFIGTSAAMILSGGAAGAFGKGASAFASTILNLQRLERGTALFSIASAVVRTTGLVANGVAFHATNNVLTGQFGGEAWSAGAFAHSVGVVGGLHMLGSVYKAGTGTWLRNAETLAATSRTTAEFWRGTLTSTGIKLGEIGMEVGAFSMMDGVSRIMAGEDPDWGDIFVEQIKLIGALKLGGAISHAATSFVSAQTRTMTMNSLEVRRAGYKTQLQTLDAEIARTRTDAALSTGGVEVYETRLRELEMARTRTLNDMASIERQAIQLHREYIESGAAWNDLPAETKAKFSYDDAAFRTAALQRAGEYTTRTIENLNRQLQSSATAQAMNNYVSYSPAAHNPSFDNYQRFITEQIAQQAREASTNGQPRVVVDTNGKVTQLYSGTRPATIGSPEVRTAVTTTNAARATKVNTLVTTLKTIQQAIASRGRVTESQARSTAEIQQLIEAARTEQQGKSWRSMIEETRMVDAAKARELEQTWRTIQETCPSCVVAEARRAVTEVDLSVRDALGKPEVTTLEVVQHLRDTNDPRLRAYVEDARTTIAAERENLRQMERDPAVDEAQIEFSKRYIAELEQGLAAAEGALPEARVTARVRSLRETRPDLKEITDRDLDLLAEVLAGERELLRQEISAESLARELDRLREETPTEQPLDAGKVREAIGRIPEFRRPLAEEQRPAPKPTVEDARTTVQARTVVRAFEREFAETRTALERDAAVQAQLKAAEDAVVQRVRAEAQTPEGTSRWTKEAQNKMEGEIRNDVYRDWAERMKRVTDPVALEEAVKAEIEHRIEEMPDAERTARLEKLRNELLENHARERAAETREETLEEIAFRTFLQENAPAIAQEIDQTPQEQQLAYTRELLDGFREAAKTVEQLEKYARDQLAPELVKIEQELAEITLQIAETTDPAMKQQLQAKRTDLASAREQLVRNRAAELLQQAEAKTIGTETKDVGGLAYAGTNKPQINKFGGDLRIVEEVTMGDGSKRMVSVVGDTTGHGRDASMVKAMFVDLVDRAIKSGRMAAEPERVAEEIRDALLPYLGMKGAQLSIVVYDAVSREAVIVSFGMEVTRITADGKTETRAATITKAGEEIPNPLLTTLSKKGETITAKRVKLEPGDVLVQMTDGVYEATAAGKDYDALAATVRAREGTAENIRDAVLQGREEYFKTETPAPDDITLNVFKVPREAVQPLPAEKPPAPKTFGEILKKNLPLGAVRGSFFGLGEAYQVGKSIVEWLGEKFRRAPEIETAPKPAEAQIPRPFASVADLEPVEFEQLKSTVRTRAEQFAADPQAKELLAGTPEAATVFLGFRAAAEVSETSLLPAFGGLEGLRSRIADINAKYGQHFEILVYPQGEAIVYDPARVRSVIESLAETRLADGTLLFTRDELNQIKTDEGIRAMLAQDPFLQQKKAAGFIFGYGRENVMGFVLASAAENKLKAQVADFPTTKEAQEQWFKDPANKPVLDKILTPDEINAMERYVQSTIARAGTAEEAPFGWSSFSPEESQQLSSRYQELLAVAKEKLDISFEEKEAMMLILPQEGETVMLLRKGQPEEWNVISYDAAQEKVTIKREQTTQELSLYEWNKQTREAISDISSEPVESVTGRFTGVSTAVMEHAGLFVLALIVLVLVAFGMRTYARRKEPNLNKTVEDFYTSAYEARSILKGVKKRRK